MDKIKLGSDWTPVKPFIRTGPQKTKVNCGPYAVMQTIYQITGEHIDEIQLTKNMYDLKCMAAGGSTLDNLVNAVDIISNGELQLKWYYFSSIGFKSLIELLEDPNRTFITSFMSLKVNRHFAIILAMQYNGGAILQLNTAKSDPLEYITKNEFSEWCKLMEGPSIGVISKVKK